MHAGLDWSVEQEGTEVGKGENGGRRKGDNGMERKEVFQDM
jgi:hypothetical protein